MNRRSFLAVLSGLPFVGKLFMPKHYPSGYTAGHIPDLSQAEPDPWIPFSVRNGYVLPTAEQRRAMGLSQRGPTLEKLDMTCLGCRRQTVIYVPSGTFRTGLLKTRKFVCVDCSMKRLED